MLNRKQVMALLMIRKRPGNLFSALPTSFSDKFVGLYNIDEEAGKLVKILGFELNDVSFHYWNERSSFANFEHQAHGLRTMVNLVLNNNKLDNIKKLFLLIKLAQDLYRYLTNMESNKFKSLLHSFMVNHHLLINNVSTFALPIIINEMPYYYHSFFNYFLGGCHIFYNAKTYFLKINDNYDDNISLNQLFEHNNQQYTLEQLVEHFLVAHDNKKATPRRPRDELDVPESVIAMHNIL